MSGRSPDLGSPAGRRLGSLLRSRALQLAVLSHAVPLVGVTLLGWSTLPLLLVYLWDGLLVGLYTAVRLLRCERPALDRGALRTSVDLLVLATIYGGALFLETLLVVLPDYSLGTVGPGILVAASVTLVLHHREHVRDFEHGPERAHPPWFHLFRAAGLNLPLLVAVGAGLLAWDPRTIVLVKGLLDLAAHAWFHREQIRSDLAETLLGEVSLDAPPAIPAGSPASVSVAFTPEREVEGLRVRARLRDLTSFRSRPWTEVEEVDRPLEPGVPTRLEVPIPWTEVLPDAAEGHHRLEVRLAGPGFAWTGRASSTMDWPRVVPVDPGRYLGGYRADLWIHLSPEARSIGGLPETGPRTLEVGAVTLAAGILPWVGHGTGIPTAGAFIASFVALFGGMILLRRIDGESRDLGFPWKLEPPWRVEAEVTGGIDRKDFPAHCIRCQVETDRSAELPFADEDRVAVPLCEPCEERSRGPAVYGSRLRIRELAGRGSPPRIRLPSPAYHRELVDRRPKVFRTCQPEALDDATAWQEEAEAVFGSANAFEEAVLSRLAGWMGLVDSAATSLRRLHHATTVAALLTAPAMAFAPRVLSERVVWSMAAIALPPLLAVGGCVLLALRSGGGAADALHDEVRGRLEGEVCTDELTDEQATLLGRFFGRFVPSGHAGSPGGT